MKWFVLESSDDDDENLEKINEYEWSMTPINKFAGDPQFIFSIHKMINRDPGITIKADLDTFYKRREEEDEERTRLGILT